MDLFQFSCIHWDLLWERICGQFWQKFLERLRRSYIILHFGKMFCKYTRSIWFIKSIISSISLVSFCQDDLCVHNSGVLKYFTNNMWWSVCDLKCGYSFVWGIVVKIQNFILVEFYMDEYEVPFPICLDKFGLKLILLGKKLGIPACFLGLFS